MTSYAYSSIFVVAMLKFEAERTCRRPYLNTILPFVSEKIYWGLRAMQLIFLGNSLKEEVINLSIT